MRISSLKQHLRGRTKAFAQDKRGGTAIIFALSAIPALALIGTAIDYTRAFESRAQLQNAIDAASLAALKEFKRGEKAMKRIARAQLDVNLPDDMKGTPFGISFTDDPQSVEIDMSWKEPTTLMNVFGFKHVQVGATGKSVRGIDNAEVALVLDVTGSMKDNFRTLKSAALDLTDIVMETPSTQMAIVPYRMTVNIGNTPTTMGYMDRRARSKWHGSNFIGLNYRLGNCETEEERKRREEREKRERENPVVANPNPNPKPNPQPNPTPKPPKKGGGSDLGSLGDWFTNKLQDFASTLNPVSPAHAGPWRYQTPEAFQVPADCRGYGPTKVNHFDLFDAMGQRWAGCVEARPFGLDERDTPPRNSNPDSLWVPYLWPDEVDGVKGTKATDVTRNDYLPFNGLDQSDGNRAWPDEAGRQKTVWKYDTETPSISNSSFVQRGPNAACPDPIVPLTDSRRQIDRSIKSLSLAGGAGTAANFGLVWGWRVLSPEIPFIEGQPYDDRNKKVIVLMTDGQNDIQEQNNHWNKSDYGAWGYLSQARLGVGDRTGFKSSLDVKMRRICNRVKDKEIEIFTVLFDPKRRLPASTANLYRNCASDPKTHYFKASSDGELLRAFNEIGNAISAMRIAN